MNDNIGAVLAVKIPGKRKPRPIGNIYAETDGEYFVYLDDKTKRRYSDHPGFYSMPMKISVKKSSDFVIIHEADK